jgi:class 3 adenylate cyclase/predicted ATPase
MKFLEVVEQVVELLQRQGRVSYRALERQFDLDDEYVEDLKEEIIEARKLAADEDGRVLVWAGDEKSPLESVSSSPTAAQETASQEDQPTPAETAPAQPAVPEAERRHLTVMFCDLVESTALSAKLDPEDLREVVRAYQQASAEVIDRYEGYIAQYLGDGLLVYFGYPQAHEDDAQRAVHAGLEIVAAIGALNAELEQDKNVELAVRVGVHTGLVVVGEMGGGGKQEQLAVGETPNIAARIQGLAESNTVVISGATADLAKGAFVLEDLGAHGLKGVAEPVPVARILGPVGERIEEDELVPDRIPLVGRDEEVGLLRRRWEQSKEGLGQVVLINGEAGIGKSALVETVRAHVMREGLPRIIFHCSPYHTHSAHYPVIVHMERLFGLEPDDSPETKLGKLEEVLAKYSFPLEEIVSLFAGLLSIPLPERYPVPTRTPQQQKQQTQDALVAWLLEKAERQPLLTVWEDLHWADPSTLEILGLLIDQVPTAPMLSVLTFRPEFVPSWPARSHMTPLTLNRLERPQVEAMLEHLAGGKALPAEVVEHIVDRTDGVPLFIGELTKMLLESDLLREEPDHYALTGPLSEVTIPATLQDSLMARLDRVPTVREVAQLGAVLGREFAYEILRELTTIEESALQEQLAQLVNVELLYQRGRPPRARYFFKHALIHDEAYASLLRSTRQQYHRQIAQLLEEQFPDLVETQPELVAHHYTEAGLNEHAVGYWQRAGQRAAGRSANAEAMRQCKKGLETLSTLPDSPERARQELTLQTTLGLALVATKGYAAEEIEQTYARARELCQQVRNTSQLSLVLRGLQIFYSVRGDMHTARELSEQLLTLAQGQDDRALLAGAHVARGEVLLFLGELASAREDLEQGRGLYEAQPQRFEDWPGAHPGVNCLVISAFVLWLLGYPDQALHRIHEGLTLAQELPLPYSLALAKAQTAWLHQFRRDPSAALEQAEGAVTLATDHGFKYVVAAATPFRDWALAAQGRGGEGMAQMRQGLAAYQATGAQMRLPCLLASGAEVCGKNGEAKEGLVVLAEGFRVINKSGERVWEAELHRLKGELTLQSGDQSSESGVQEEAEECFQQALGVARRQQAKSLELRAATSLSRLWQHQGKRVEARELLGGIYDWFTEGFDTADLKEAKALLEDLS